MTKRATARRGFVAPPPARNDLAAAYRRLTQTIGKPDERPLNRAERRAKAKGESA
jgi:hypothetical protein